MFISFNSMIMDPSEERYQASVIPFAVRLFLDDIREIEGIYTSAYAKLNPPIAISFLYQVGEQHYTSLEELRELGSSTTDFRMWLSSKDEENTEVLTFRLGVWSPITGELQKAGTAWEVALRVRRLLERRIDPYRLIFERVPNFSLGAVLIGLFWLLLALIGYSKPIGRFMSVSQEALNAVMVVTAGLFVCIYFGALVLRYRDSRVFLHYTHQMSKARREKLLKAAGAIGLVLLGAVINRMMASHK